MAGQAIQCPKCKLHEKVPNPDSILHPTVPPSDNSPKIKFLCERCNGVINAPESLAGKLYPCPRCLHFNTVPGLNRLSAASPGNWFHLLAVIILIAGILLALGLSGIFFFFAFSLSMVLFAFGSIINHLAEITFYLKKRDSPSKKS